MIGRARRPHAASDRFSYVALIAALIAYGVATEVNRLVDAPLGHAAWLAGKSWKGLVIGCVFLCSMGLILLAVQRPRDVAVHRLLLVFSIVMAAWAAWQFAPTLALRFGGTPQVRGAELVEAWWVESRGGSRRSGRAKATIEPADGTETVVALEDEEKWLVGLPPGTPLTLRAIASPLGLHVQRIERDARRR